MRVGKRSILHLEEEHSEIVNGGTHDGVHHAAKPLSPLMATYDGLTVNLQI